MAKTDSETQDLETYLAGSTDPMLCERRYLRLIQLFIDMRTEERLHLPVIVMCIYIYIEINVSIFIYIYIYLLCID